MPYGRSLSLRMKELEDGSWEVHLSSPSTRLRTMTDIVDAAIRGLIQFRRHVECVDNIAAGGKTDDEDSRSTPTDGKIAEAIRDERRDRSIYRMRDSIPRPPDAIQSMAARVRHSHSCSIEF